MTPDEQPAGAPGAETRERRLRTDGGGGPAHREGPDSAASAAAAIEVDTADVPETEPAAMYDQMRAGEDVTVLDVRGPDEVAAWRIDGPGLEYLNVPAARFVEAHPDHGQVRGLVEGLSGQPVVVVCPRGRASERVAAVLQEAGVEATNLRDGMRGWASVYVATALPTGDDGPAVRQYDRPSSGCLGYMVHAGGEAVVVDPLRAFVDRYVADAEDLGVEIVAVVDTHVHADHVSGLRDLAAAADARAVVPEGALDRGLAFADSVRTVADGDRIEVGSTHVEAVALPGHTTEMTGLLAGETLLSGDSLFLESVARPDLEAGDEGAPELAAHLHRTLQETVLALPGETLLAPGHHGPGVTPTEDGAYVAPLSTVREGLSVLGLDREAFVDRIVADMPPRPANFEEIIHVNLGRETATPDRAFTLELGPNNCAATPEPADAD